MKGHKIPRLCLHKTSEIEEKSSHAPDEEINEQSCTSARDVNFDIKLTLDNQIIPAP